MKPKMMELARKLSYKSNHKKARLGCVIVKRNKILGIGFNMLKTHPRSPSKWHQRHAEFEAVLNVDRFGESRLEGTEAYIYREYKNGYPALARPCQSCEALLRDLGVRRIYYTCNEGWVEELLC